MSAYHKGDVLRMCETLNFLKDYRDDVFFVSINDVDKIDGNVPKLWLDVISESNRVDRVKKLLSVWEQYIGEYLNCTIAYLRENLEDVAIIGYDGVFSLLYTIKNSNNDVVYYEGRVPYSFFDNSDLEKAWDKIPLSIKCFYEQLHNGFFEFTSEAMGLVPFEFVTYLGDDDLEWGILDELIEPIQIDLTSTFGFFSNGAGSYVAIDYTNCANGNATFWSAKMQPKYNVSFWRYVDEWFCIGFEV